MQLDVSLLHVVVRWLHVSAMAVAFGGVFLVLIAAWDRADRVTDVAKRYEWAFWSALGVLAMTGIGNLGAFGAALPEPTTPWGQTLTVKLGTVIALALISLPRTLAVSVWPSPPDPGGTRRIRAVYATTTAIFALIVAFAELLAHR